MNPKLTIKRLTLHKETLRALNETDMNNIAGGGNPTTTTTFCSCACSTQDCCITVGMSCRYVCAQPAGMSPMA